MGYNFAEIKKQITSEQIIKLMMYLGARSYEEKPGCIVFPTICHNAPEHAHNMKLYYYLDTKLFHCYTECNSSFDIFTLFEKIKQREGIDCNLQEIANEIVNKLNLTFEEDNLTIKYEQPLKRAITGESYYEYPKVDTKVLDNFKSQRIRMWEEEGIDFFALLKFGVHFYFTKNKIIIPHYDILNQF